jgi:hypothetical protein
MIRKSALASFPFLPFPFFFSSFSVHRFFTGLSDCRFPPACATLTEPSILPGNPLFDHVPDYRQPLF